MDERKNIMSRKTLSNELVVPILIDREAKGLKGPLWTRQYRALAYTQHVHKILMFAFSRVFQTNFQMVQIQSE